MYSRRARYRICVLFISLLRRGTRPLHRSSGSDRKGKRLIAFVKYLYPTGWMVLAALTIAWIGIGGINSVLNSLAQRRTDRRSDLITAAGGTVASLNGIQFVGQSVSDENLSRVSSLADTTWLELHTTNVTGQGLSHIADWKKLRQLYLNYNPITDEGLFHLKDLHSIERLELKKTSVTDAGLLFLANAKNLNHLDLSDTQVSDKGLAALAGLKNLRILRLHNTSVTSTGISQLERDLPWCRIDWAVGQSGTGGGSPQTVGIDAQPTASTEPSVGPTPR